MAGPELVAGSDDVEMRASDDLLAMSMYVVYNASHVISHVAGGVAEATTPCAPPQTWRCPCRP